MINIYSTPSCPYCHMVKDYLKSKNIEFNDYNVAEDQAKAQEMVQKSGQMGVPVIEIENNILVGFDKPEIDRLLNL